MVNLILENCVYSSFCFYLIGSKVGPNVFHVSLDQLKSLIHQSLVLCVIQVCFFLDLHFEVADR